MYSYLFFFSNSISDPFADVECLFISSPLSNVLREKKIEFGSDRLLRKKNLNMKKKIALSKYCEIGSI